MFFIIKRYAIIKQLKPLTNCYAMFVSLPEMCDQAVTETEAAGITQPHCKLTTAYFHMLFLQIVCMDSAVSRLSCQVITEGRVLKTHLHAMMRWEIISYLSYICVCV
ncbi:Hypothetical predicted protein [Xyrichtys novacula]|uniref:Uncharacterized protein n=1 Tax=Xyrichtys novacula TaxID=13765 RepID=A0AAV1EUL6_XYRNO|nr:Hypothetical predicted protein [Xyrichtys novacula]